MQEIFLRFSYQSQGRPLPEYHHGEQDGLKETVSTHKIAPANNFWNTPTTSSLAWGSSKSFQWLLYEQRSGPTLPVRSVGRIWHCRPQNFTKQAKTYVWYHICCFGLVYIVSLWQTSNSQHCWCILSQSLLGVLCATRISARPTVVLYTRPIGDIIRSSGPLFHLLADDSQLYKPATPSNMEQLQAFDAVELCIRNILG